MWELRLEPRRREEGAMTLVWLSLSFPVRTVCDRSSARHGEMREWA